MVWVSKKSCHHETRPVVPRAIELPHWQEKSALQFPVARWCWRRSLAWNLVRRFGSYSWGRRGKDTYLRRETDVYDPCSHREAALSVVPAGDIVQLIFIAINYGEAWDFWARRPVGVPCSWESLWRSETKMSRPGSSWEARSGRSRRRLLPKQKSRREHARVGARRGLQQTTAARGKRHNGGHLGLAISRLLVR